MKNILKSLVLLLAVSFMTSCGGGNNPESVAEDFLVALGTQDYEKARELGTERTAQLVSLVQGMADMAKKDGEDVDVDNMPDIEFTNTEIDGDKATCFYTSADGEEKKINLLKVDGEWKVDMTKEQ